MAPSKSLRRLLRVRQLEEEQRRAELETGLATVHQLQSALAWTAARDRRGRLLIDMSAHNGDLQDRIAGFEESQTAARHTDVLGEMMVTAEEKVNLMRESYLAKRVERMQAETLIREGEALENMEQSRRGQQDLDDWHQSRRRAKLNAATRSQPQLANPKSGS